MRGLSQDKGGSERAGKLWSSFIVCIIYIQVRYRYDTYYINYDRRIDIVLSTSNNIDTGVALVFCRFLRHPNNINLMDICQTNNIRVFWIIASLEAFFLANFRTNTNTNVRQKYDDGPMGEVIYKSYLTCLYKDRRN